MPLKICPECSEGSGVRTLKCKCGYVFMKGKADIPKKPMKIKFDTVNDDEDQDENHDNKVEDISTEKVTKKINLSLAPEEKLTVDKLVIICKPFNNLIDDGKLIFEGYVFISGRGMDNCTYNSKPILPCQGVYAKVIANSKDGTLSVWVLDSNGEPDLVYLNAVV